MNQMHRPNKPKVLLAPYFRTLREIFSLADLERLHDIADVVWARDEPLPETVLEEYLADVEIMVGANWVLSADQINRAEKLRVIMDVAGSFPPQVDYGACFARGIRVLGCAPAFGKQVAEMALALTLASSRSVVRCHEEFRDGTEIWQEDKAGDFSLFGAELGFIGFGAIATNFLSLVRPFDCRVRVFDPWLPSGLIEDAGCQPASLDEVLTVSRSVYVFAPPTTENYHLLNAENLAKMKRHALLALISRAHLVDFDALISAAAENRIRVAADVFPQEPLPIDHPIRKIPGVVLSSHRAASIRELRRAIGKMVADDIELISLGLPPRLMQQAQPELVRRQAGAER